MIDRRRRSSSRGIYRRSLQPTGKSIGCIRCCKSFLIALSTCLFIGVKVGRYDTCYRCATNKQHKRFKVTATNNFLCALRAQVTNQINKRLPDGAAVVVDTGVIAAYTSACQCEALFWCYGQGCGRRGEHESKQPDLLRDTE